jgi:hypothetical protein
VLQLVLLGSLLLLLLLRQLLLLLLLRRLSFRFLLLVLNLRWLHHRCGVDERHAKGIEQLGTICRTPCSVACCSKASQCRVCLASGLCSGGDTSARKWL